MATLAELLAAKVAASQPKAGQPQINKPLPIAPGGSRLADIKHALATAKLGSQRNKLPLGTGWFLLKNGQFKKTEQKGFELSNFSFICIKAIEDGQGLPPTSSNYTGPRVGETYEVAIFQGGSFLSSTMAKSLSALAACMGWSKDYTEQLQSTEEGVLTIMELLKGLLCVSVQGEPTNLPCAFANQVVVELHTGAKQVEELSKVDKKPVYEKDGTPKMITRVNTYWNHKVKLVDEVYATIPEADVIKYFGSQEAFLAAVETEQMALAG
jgi:hypothetical protein